MDTVKNMRYLLLWCCLWSEVVAQSPKLQLELVTSGFYRPCDLVVLSDTDFLVAQTNGKIQLVKNGQTTTFLDISTLIDEPDWGGIYGITIHPQYALNGYLYVHYTRKGDMASVIARFTRQSANPNLADPNSRKTILTIAYPNGGHRSGRIGFGPDGYLYITTGDSSLGARHSIGDTEKLAQNLQDMHGKMLRIDVNAGDPYAIPPGNPYASPSDGIADELYASGLRNPWRWSFDRRTGDFWLGDVGQDGWEELNFTAAGTTTPQNYGWPCFEGSHAYNASCPANVTYHMPLLDYGGYDTAGDACITGGYVYRGNRYYSLWGWYVYADYSRGTYWTLKRTNTGAYQQIQQAIPLSTSPASFGEGPNGELYVLSLLDGKLYRIGVDAIVSTQNGNWSMATTWTCNCTPTANDQITVSASKTVTVSQPVASKTLILNGTLVLTNGGRVSFN